MAYGAFIAAVLSYIELRSKDLCPKTGLSVCGDLNLSDQDYLL